MSPLRAKAARLHMDEEADPLTTLSKNVIHLQAMAAPQVPQLGGYPVDLQDVISAQKDELGPAPEDPLCDAIRRDEDNAIRTHSLGLKGLPTLAPKRLAIQKGRPDILKSLLLQDGLIEEDLVAAACLNKDHACFRALLDAGWPINNAIGYDASMLGLVIDDLEFIQWLVANGADVNARNMLDEIALSKAVVVGSMDLVHFLLSKRTNVQHGDLLHNAARRRNRAEGAALVKELVQRGADPNAYRYHNPVAFRLRAPFDLPTPLHVACRETNVPVANALIHNGASPRCRMLEAWKETGPTPLQLAKELGSKDLIDLLEHAPADAADWEAGAVTTLLELDHDTRLQRRRLNRSQMYRQGGLRYNHTTQSWAATVLRSIAIFR
ncbi:hypothetical protein LTR95_008862 [Oleoguttula sp. CCFEE 5521]